MCFREVKLFRQMIKFFKLQLKFQLRFLIYLIDYLSLIQHTLLDKNLWSLVLKIWKFRFKKRGRTGKEKLKVYFWPKTWNWRCLWQNFEKFSQHNVWSRLLEIINARQPKNFVCSRDAKTLTLQLVKKVLVLWIPSIIEYKISFLIFNIFPIFLLNVSSLKTWSWAILKF